MRVTGVLAGAYVALLAVSHFVRLASPEQEPDPGTARVARLPAVDGERRLERTIRLVYDDLPGVEVDVDDRPAVLLLHGSPGGRGDFRGMVPSLAARFRVIVPDLPGFGQSERDLPDYSIRAHAGYLVELLTRLRIERAHVVGFSLGGGVALNLTDLAPDRVASLTLLSSIGVQELELFGEHRANHAVHAAQLALLWLAREGLPHMGRLDRSFLGVEYARNFLDSDQRPLRGILERWDGPSLIIHGRRDVLVPVEAALENHRLLPQSELALVDADHFMVFVEPERMSEIVGGFIESVERGAARTRRSAGPDRLARAALAFDRDRVPPARGLALVLMLTLVIVAGFVRGDLACLGTGLLVAFGQAPLLPLLAAAVGALLVADLAALAIGRAARPNGAGRQPPGRPARLARRLLPGFKRALARQARRTPGISRLVGWTLLTALFGGSLLVLLGAFAGRLALAAAGAPARPPLAWLAAALATCWATSWIVLIGRAGSR